MLTRNPALLLSEEAQDLILDFVGSLDSKSAYRTHRAFCLVSRHWLSSGRRALYRKPFDAGINTLAAAKSLLAAVEEKPGLAISVRELLVATPWSKLKSSAEDLASKWVLRMIQACRSATTISIPMDKKYAAELGGALPTTVSYLAIRSFDELPFDVDDYDSFVASLSLRTLSVFKVVNFNWKRSKAVGATPSFPFYIRKLIMDKCQLVDEQYLRFIHTIGPTKLWVRTKVGLSPTSAKIIVEACGNALEELSYAYRSKEAQRDLRLEDYGYQRKSNPTPLELFAPLPKLKRFKLHDGKRMDLIKLKALISGSPVLERVDLLNCTWAFGSSMGYEARDACVTALPSIKAALQELPVTCKNVHLGTLPVLDGATSSSLGLQLPTVKIKFQTCLPVYDEYDSVYDSEDCDCEECYYERVYFEGYYSD